MSVDLGSQVRDTPRGDPAPVDADSLLTRTEALGRFVRAASGVIDAGRLATARALAERAGQRLAHSREHTVVALAGATGSGKSSLFNALSGFTLSDVGVRRPTTADPHACAWGISAAGTLLDWLDIPEQLRFDRESVLDAEDEAGLRGLVLIDMPDFDSVAAEHRAEADRLLDLVDLVIWVTDPQKYADRVLHERYLRAFRRHREITVVVLNQADRLTAVDLERCTADLRRLLAADGLDGVPVLATTANDGPAGVLDLRRELEKAVTARHAQLRRMGNDVAELVDGLSDAVGPAPVEIDRNTLRGLAEALAAAVGVSAVVSTVGQAYRYQAWRIAGWPPLRYRRRTPDPLTPLRPERTGERAGPAPAARRALLGLAVRGIGERAGADLPEPWASAVGAAARSRLDDLPGALGDALAGTDPGPGAARTWWRLTGILQWLLLAVAAAGLVIQLFLPDLTGSVAPVFVVAAALLAGPVLALLTAPLVTAGARRARRRAESRLALAATEVASEYVIRPIRETLGRYADAREALRAARG